MPRLPSPGWLWPARWCRHQWRHGREVGSPEGEGTAWQTPWWSLTRSVTRRFRRRQADILFTGTEAGGSAGCDRFMASYATDGVSSLTFGPIATTMKLCERRQCVEQRTSPLSPPWPATSSMTVASPCPMPVVRRSSRTHP